MSRKDSSIVFLISGKNKITKRFPLYSITKSSNEPQSLAALCMLLFIELKKYEVHQNYRSEKFSDPFPSGRIKKEI